NLLLYIATHDIKNDVYSVVMNSKIINSIKELNEATRTKLIEEIQNSSCRVYDFIEKITLLLKMGRGKFTTNMSVTNLFGIIGQIISKYENIVSDKKLKIDFFGDKNISVFGDKDIIAEIFDNLISNAVKYSRYGGFIGINITTKKKYASVSIKDGGPGLDNYEKKKLFKEFYITKNNYDSGVKRVGLGLYITKNLVRLLKGRISVNSEKGDGSVFIVYLPK
ncbi:MAG: HAMP domain-containing histidine kinase, partial [Spirochaetes bacterium]|nr:HAMP domain-containing histidine kinase [Spirochaetota bacterium]